jgi:CBS-domain-containing membrane protein
MQAADVMTRAVITIQPNSSVISAIRLMLSQRISGLPVVTAGGKLVGMLTEGDLLRRAELGTGRTRPQWLDFIRGPGERAAEYVREHGRTVEEIMTADVVTVGEATPLDDVVTLMEKKHIKRVPVVTDEHLIGVVSRADLLNALNKALSQELIAPSSDEALQARVLGELNKQKWVARGQVTVTVADRVAALDGIIYDVRERDALRVAVENTPGVKSVQDHLHYIDPQEGLIYPLG